MGYRILPATVVTKQIIISKIPIVIINIQYIDLYVYTDYRQQLEVVACCR